MRRLKFTSYEIELIELIRNYRNAYPNGKEQMELDIEELVARLMDPNNK